MHDLRRARLLDPLEVTAARQPAGELVGDRDGECRRVDRRADRGPKLKEPTKICSSSIEKVFACRLELERLLQPRSDPGGLGPDDARFVSNSATPASSSAFRCLA